MSAAEVSERALNRSTLARQALIERSTDSVVDVVRRLVGLQAQEPAAPYVALWNRIDSFDAGQLDEAFARRDIVKAPMMRITLHAVAADDHPTLHTVMRRVLRAARVNDRRFREAGLSPAEADDLTKPLATWADTPRSKADILQWLDTQCGGEAEPRLWWALRTYAPLIHAPVDAPWNFDRRQLFEAAPASSGVIDPQLAARTLAIRYLAAFGPASAADFAQFTMLKKSLATQILETLSDELTMLSGPGGITLFDIAGRDVADPDTPCPPRLLGMWDSTLLAYSDRSRIIPDQHRAHVIRRNGDVLPSVLVDGYVAGVWRPIDNGIEVTPFSTLAPDTWDYLEAEAIALCSFLEPRDPTTFSRYANWWTKLPDEHCRIIGHL